MFSQALLSADNYVENYSNSRFFFDQMDDMIYLNDANNEQFDWIWDYIIDNHKDTYFYLYLYWTNGNDTVVKSHGDVDTIEEFRSNRYTIISKETTIENRGIYYKLVAHVDKKIY